ncbi:hypothetical protein NPIL_520951 [Nephila pilipes]|uniref:Uncharacterized protein n=1 Tax=Nephila pilipes TaxID=299642 RepID=A0A8X6NHC8_NEPPI|nr:hypothetical protein NPIL_520951 [Nephila pilipes]
MQKIRFHNTGRRLSLSTPVHSTLQLRGWIDPERFPAGRTKTTLISFFFLRTMEVGCYGQSVQAATPLIRLTDLENFVSSPDDSSLNVAHTVFQQDALQMTELRLV